MAITFVATGAAASGLNAISPALPSGLAAGDLMLLFVQTSNQTPTTPTNWNVVGAGLVGSGTAAAAGSVGLIVYWKVAASGESAPSVPTGLNHLIGFISAYRGVNGTSPINISSGTTATSSTAVSIAAVTTTVTNCMVVGVSANSVDSNTVQITAFTSTASALTSFATDTTTSTNTTSGTGGGVQACHGLLAAATTTNTITATQGTASVQAKYMIALTPAVTTNQTVATTNANTLGQLKLTNKLVKFTEAEVVASARQKLKNQAVAISNAATIAKAIHVPVKHRRIRVRQGQGTLTPIIDWAGWSIWQHFAFGDITFSSDGSMWTKTDTDSSWRTVLSNFVTPTTGKFYAEYTCTTLTNSAQIGMMSVNSDQSPNTRISATAGTQNTVAMREDGVLTGSHAGSDNQIYGSTGVTYTAGDTVAIAWDIDNKKVWWRVNGGAWVGSLSAGDDPATNTGGFDTAANIQAGVMNNCCFAASLFATGNQMTLNLGGAPLKYTPPNGFSSPATSTVASVALLSSAVSTSSPSVTFSNGNLTVSLATVNGTDNNVRAGYFLLGAENVYWEITHNTSIASSAGVYSIGHVSDTYVGNSGTGDGMWMSSDGKVYDATNFIITEGPNPTWATGDTIRYAWNGVNGTLFIGDVLGNWYGQPSLTDDPTLPTGGLRTARKFAFLPYVNLQNVSTATINFGASDFVYGPPDGYRAFQNMVPASSQTAASGSCVFNWSVVVRPPRLSPWRRPQSSRQGD
jgi:hypothetical protein